ncbi:MAG: NAD(P)/FAD-dependent oxidoreductase [Mycoplasma sp.]
MQKPVFDVLVIGAGPVGIYGAYLAKEKGLNVLLIEATETLGGQPLNLYPVKDIHDYPGFVNIKSMDLVKKLVEQLNHLKVEYKLKTTLKSFSHENNVFNCVLSDNTEIVSNNIIVAIGNGAFAPNLLDIPGAKDNKNIHYLVTSYEQYQNKSVVILGGGDSAVDWANNISTNTNAKVTIVHRRTEFRANGVNVEQLTKNKVNIILNCDCVEIKNDNELVLLNKTTNQNQTIKFDYLIVQYGQKLEFTLPSWTKAIKINQANKILVDQNNQTNIKNIYAVGNIVGYVNRPNMTITGHGECANAINDILAKKRNYENLQK